MRNKASYLVHTNVGDIYCKNQACYADLYSLMSVAYRRTKDLNQLPEGIEKQAVLDHIEHDVDWLSYLFVPLSYYKEERQQQYAPDEERCAFSPRDNGTVRRLLDITKTTPHKEVSAILKAMPRADLLKMVSKLATHQDMKLNINAVAVHLTACKKEGDKEAVDTIRNILASYKLTAPYMLKTTGYNVSLKVDNVPVQIVQLILHTLRLFDEQYCAYTKKLITLIKNYPPNLSMLILLLYQVGRLSDRFFSEDNPDYLLLNDLTNVHGDGTHTLSFLTEYRDRRLGNIPVSVCNDILNGSLQSLDEAYYGVDKPVDKYGSTSLIERYTGHQAAGRGGVHIQKYWNYEKSRFNTREDSYVIPDKIPLTQEGLDNFVKVTFNIDV